MVQGLERVPRSDDQQRGQAAIEWLGTLLLLLVVLVGIATALPGVGSRIACAIEQQIAVLSGGTADCADADRGRARTAPPPRLTPFGAPDRTRAAGPANKEPKPNGARYSGKLTTARFGPNAIASRRSRAVDDFRRGYAFDAALKVSLGDILSFLEGPVVAEMGGYLVPVKQMGVPIPTRLIRKAYGIGAAAASRARAYAKRLGIGVELLLSSQRFAATRVSELQKALPAASRGRVTMAVGIGKDSAGRLRIVVGTSARGGSLRGPVAARVKDSGAAVAKGYSGHAEIQVISYMRDNGLKLVTVGAGRPICAECAAAVRRAGGTFATRVKQTPRKP